MAGNSNQVRLRIGNSLNQAPDQFSPVVAKARSVLASVQKGLLPKAATNTAENTNVRNLAKTIGDLADLVEHTSDPVWKETYRVALVRTLAACEKANQNVGATPMTAKAISDAGQDLDTFNSAFVGLPDAHTDVSLWTARQAGYQQRFNPPPAALPPPALPLDPTVATSEYNWLDVPERGTTAIRTQTNPNGSFLQPNPTSPVGSSNR